jgi:antitoxin HicB
VKRYAPKSLSQINVCKELECAKLGIYKVMTDQGIKKAELARRLGWHTPQVDRLFDLRHASKFDQIEAAAAVLNRHVEIRIAA